MDIWHRNQTVLIVKNKHSIEHSIERVAALNAVLGTALDITQTQGLVEPGHKMPKGRKASIKYSGHGT